MDGDGVLEALVQRGGGNGFSPKPPFLVKWQGGKGKGTKGKDNWNQDWGDDKGLTKGARGRAGKFMDIDHDGDLDLVLVNAEIKVGPGPRQILYKNTGGEFKYMGKGKDLGGAVGSHGLVVDYNDDGELDLLLGHNLRMLKGTKWFGFTDVTKSVLPESYKLVMAMAEIDIDNDGDMDLYLARGWGQQDVLLENVKGKYFVDISEKAGLITKFDGAYRSMVTVGDFNNDGYMDVFLTRRNWPNHKKGPRLADYLLMNNGKKGFKIYSKHGAVTPKWDGYGDGAQAFDFDNDGRLDILSSSEKGRWRLFRNLTPRSPKAKYLLVRILRSPGKKKGTPMGAVVPVWVAKKLFRRRVGAAGANFQQSQLDIVHFGLGNIKKITKVVVVWTNKQSKTVWNPKPNSTIKVGVI